MSQILEAIAPQKFYLTRTACLGILRRAKERGKQLPPELEETLLLQSEIPPDGLAEVLRLAARREGSLDSVAFACNQRDEVRDLKDVSAALCAEPGMKQQTFVAAAFCAGAAPTARSIGYEQECSPTLKAASSGTNMVPTVLCLNDQGGERMDLSVDVTGTLRSHSHGHEALVLPGEMYYHHAQDARVTGPHDVASSVVSRQGTGGNAPHLTVSPMAFYARSRSDRYLEQEVASTQYAGQDKRTSDLVAGCVTFYTQNRTDRHLENHVASAQSARQYKSATDLVVAGIDCRNLSENGDIYGTLQSKGEGGYSLNYTHAARVGRLIRRLMPAECERLMGFPDGWTDIPGASDTVRYRALGNSVAIPCVEYIMMGLREALAA